jgi:hypothetical protein
VAWAGQHGIGRRIGELPLVLCGPVLGRVEPESVTVWVALKAERTVTLRVYARSEPAAPTALTEKAIGTRRTVKLGDSLHVVAVTATPTGGQLVPGELYFYDLFFSASPAVPVVETSDGLRTPGVADPASGVTVDDLLEPSNLSYSHEHRLPSFSLPPDELNKLRLVNGSCRKPHGDNGLDALPVLDEILVVDWPVADERPHQLLLTGDQVYADGAAALMLFLVMDAAQALLDWEEPLPGNPPANELRPDKRKRVVKEIAGLTTDGFESHMLRLGEFVVLHLFAWSNVLWPEEFPTVEEVYGRSRSVPASFKDLETFRKTVGRVRRTLANVPTYMIFDDHDVTDDWNMYRDWAEKVYPKPLGRRVVQNGLTAYAICQAWSSVPDRFAGNTPGEALLSAVAAWAANQGADAAAEQQIATRVGIPPVQTAPNGTVTGGLFKSDEDGDVLERPDGALDWHFTVRGPKHEVLALDSRTRRSFPTGRLDRPAHIGSASLREQIPVEEASPDAITLVIATTNLLTVPFFEGRSFYGDKRATELLRYWYLTLFRDWAFELCFQGDYEPDLSDSWQPHSAPFEAVIARLARRAAPSGTTRSSRAIVLSGDIHFSWAGRMRYWAERPFQEDDGSALKPLDAIFAFLTSSALKAHGNPISSMVHGWGYVPASDALPEPARWLGWRRRTALGVSDADVGRMADWVQYEPWMLRQTPPMLAVKDVPQDAFVPRPDWRYRVDFLLGEKMTDDHGAFAALENPNPADHDEWLSVVKEAHARHRGYAHKWGNGLEMIGKNNLAVLRFHWEGDTTLATAISAGETSLRLTDSSRFPDPPFRVTIDGETLEVGALDREAHVCSELVRGALGSTEQAHAAGAKVAVAKAAVQTHWWRLTDETRLQPLTTYTVSLEYDDRRYPRPKLPGEADS